MKFLLVLFFCFLLVIVSWPIALCLLLFWPVLWLLSIPFRIVATAVEALLALVGALLFLPARILGHRR